MSAYGQKTLDTLIAAYGDAERKQPAHYPALPAWDDLPVEMREACSHSSLVQFMSNSLKMA